MSKRIVWVPLLVVLATLTAGCRQETVRGRFLAIPAPPSWQTALTEMRQSKDVQFQRDPTSPILPENKPSFRGLDYYEPDPAYYFVGQVEYYAQPESLEIITTAGQVRPARKVGQVEVPLPNGAQRLQVYQLLDEQPDERGFIGFFLPFKDLTSGKETYEAGRYLQLEGPPNGPFVLDFNKAANPWCAYGAPERYACPVTPQENRLDIEIKVGERKFDAGA